MSQGSGRHHLPYRRHCHHYHYQHHCWCSLPAGKTVDIVHVVQDPSDVVARHIKVVIRYRLILFLHICFVFGSTSSSSVVANGKDKNFKCFAYFNFNCVLAVPCTALPIFAARCYVYGLGRVPCRTRASQGSAPDNLDNN